MDGRPPAARMWHAGVRVLGMPGRVQLFPAGTTVARVGAYFATDAHIEAFHHQDTTQGLRVSMCVSKHLRASRQEGTSSSCCNTL